MIYTTLFLIALGVSLVGKLWLEHRQIQSVKHHRAEVPAQFRDSITLEEHQKAADYTLARARLGRWSLLYDMALLLMWTLGGGLQASHDFAASLGYGELTTGVITILLVVLVSSVLSLPFSLYSTFVIESRFGFNRTTVSTWLLDLIKASLLGLVIATPLLYGVLWLMQSAGNYWWLYAWAGFFGFSLLLSWAFPTLIAPLFNKFSPLQNETLEAHIQALMQQAGFQSKGIFVMDGSRRSSHGNAYFTGLGKNKRIVFFDTLLKSLAPQQILAVLAHELGHFKHKHILKGMVLSAVMTLAGFAILAWLLPQPEFYHGLGVQTPTLALALLLFVFVSPVFTWILSPLMSLYSRRHEFEADAFAASQTDANDLVTALVKLYQDNANTLTPDPLHSAFYDSHPPALIRIQHLQQCNTA
ncbi:MAG TPA: M48 family peptidase [Gammaproteobacteria bacterium]|nr:M48 family peptidase [Gammaproteobacteria bacterium]